MRLAKGMLGRVGGAGAAARRLLGDFGRSSQGNVAMIFALVMPILVMVTMGGVDLNRASTVRVNLQDALDAAALAAARSSATTNSELKTIGLAALKANLQAYPSIKLREDLTTFTIDSNGVITAKAKVDVDALVANIVLPPYGKLLDDKLVVGAEADVTRATGDIELAMVLDVTGSMEGTRLTDLKAAANDLVDEIVKDNQSTAKTRVAIVPYSMGVNAGDYADTVRGALKGPTTITGASWSTGTAKTITGITRASPGVITSTNHGFVNNDYVWISGVNGMTQINGRAYRVVKINNNSYSLQYRSGSNWYALNTTSGNGYSSYSSGGSATKCQVANCDVVVTSSNHAMETGNDVRISGVKGMTQINNTIAVSGSNLNHTITKISASTFSLNDIQGPLQSTYSSAGQAQCLEHQCQFYLFTNDEGNLRVFEGTKCVTERVGGQAYTSASSSGAPVGLAYTGTTDVAYGGCMTTGLTPLTDNKSTLHSAINAFKAEGGTAGQIGAAWGWYMLTPAFANIFPASSRPEPYNTRDLRKVVILMTDGQFNAIHCNGVRARDSGVGGGSPDRQINCDGTNGDPFSQTRQLCAGMKAQGVIVYTVGFDIGTAPETIGVMSQCATSPQHAFLPASGASLKTAFATIARGISALRISR